MLMLFRCTSIVCIFCLALGFVVSAQEQPETTTPERAELQYSIGIIGGVDKIWNTTLLPIIPGSTECGTFLDGTSLGARVGITVDYPVVERYVDLSGRLLYSSRPAILEASTQVSEVLDPTSNEYVPFVLGHTYEASLGYLVVDIGARIRPLPTIVPLYARLAVDAGNALFKAEFEQFASVNEPSSVLFSDGTKRHKVDGGTIQDVATSYGASAAIGAEIPLREHLLLTPEVAYRHGLNSVLQRSEWNVRSVHAALGIQWLVYREQPMPPVPPAKEAEVEEQPDAPLPLVITSLSSRPLEVQETIVTQTFPLLPYVFFDSAGATLRERYQPSVPDKEVFQEQALPRNALATYYHLLHIVGNRMRERPQAQIVITGTTDGRELPTAAQRQALAQQRAQALANVLINEWGIEPKRISVRTVDKPELASSERYAEGSEENRRAELSSNDPTLLAPVAHSRFLEYVPIQNHQQFSVQVLHPERADGWDLSVFHGQNLMAFEQGEKAPGSSVDITLEPETLKALGRVVEAGQSTLKGELQIVQDDGSVLQGECLFPIKKTLNQFEISRLSLIVFDFDRFDISGQNKEMMKRFVADAVKPTSDVFITGSTDRLGEAQYNVELSQSRAEAVNTYLLSLQPQARVQSVQGTGASTLPYDNNVPEGRYYCRTVSLEVRTPVAR